MFLKRDLEGMNGGTSRVLSYNHCVISCQNPLHPIGKSRRVLSLRCACQGYALNPKNDENFWRDFEIRGGVILTNGMLTGRINIRVTEYELKKIKEDAEESGLSLSEYGRRRLLGLRVNSKLDVRVVGELRKLGGLIKHLHNESNGMYSNESAEMLRAITKYIQNLMEGTQNDSENTTRTA